MASSLSRKEQPKWYLNVEELKHKVDCDKQYQFSIREMDDGADMWFRNSRAARNPIQGLGNVL